MKKIIFFFILLISLTGFGQYPVKQTMGSDSTIVRPKGALQSRLINIVFTDTAQANTQRIKFYDGSQIITITGGNKFWIRDSTFNKWIQVGEGSFNTSIGSGYKVAVDGTNNVKSIFGSTWISLDSTTNANAVTINNIGLFGKSGNDVRATAARSFSFANQNFTLDSVGAWLTTLRSGAFGSFSINKTGDASSRLLINSSQTMIQGITTTGKQSQVQMLDGYLYSIASDSSFIGAGTAVPGSSTPTYIKVYPHELYLIADSAWIELSMTEGIEFYPPLGKLRSDSLNNTLLATEKMVTWDSLTGYFGTRAISSGAALAVALSDITAATASNTIDNLDNNQIWDFSTLSGSNGPGLTVRVNSTAATSNNQVGFAVSLLGANANAAQLTTSGYFSNVHTGTSPVNRAIWATASGGTTNQAIHVEAGDVNIQPLTAAKLVGTDGSKNLVSVSTITNTRWTARVGSTTSSGTPTINTDNVDIYKLTAQAADITSMTTNLSGAPVDGDVLEIQITGTAARAITWGASFVASTVALPTTTVTTATLSVIFQYFTTSSYGNNKWVCVNSF